MNRNEVGISLDLKRSDQLAVLRHELSAPFGTYRAADGVRLEIEAELPALPSEQALARLRQEGIT